MTAPMTSVRIAEPSVDGDDAVHEKLRTGERDRNPSKSVAHPWEHPTSFTS